jgi:hypothetical protein
VNTWSSLIRGLISPEMLATNIHSLVTISRRVVFGDGNDGDPTTRPLIIVVVLATAWRWC